MLNSNHPGSSRRPFSRGSISRNHRNGRMLFSPHPHHSQRNNNTNNSHGGGNNGGGGGGGNHQWYKDMIDPCYQLG